MSNQNLMYKGSAPMVSVLMITYGHEKYIEEAILSVLNQKTNFKCELIIGNDNSPDRTDEIVLKLIEENTNPNFLISYTKNESNLGMMPNFISIFKNANGKYLALCEGDDFWVDNLKLKKQVDFLESNLDYNMVVSNYNLYYQATNQKRQNRELFNRNQVLTLKNYIAFNFGHTSTFLFRNNFKLPNWVKNVRAGDQSIFILAVDNKKIKYFTDVFSAYRIHLESVTHKVDTAVSKSDTLFFLDRINEHTNEKYQILINHRKLLNNLYYHISSSKFKFRKKIFLILFVILRWFGVNILVKFVK